MPSVASIDSPEKSWPNREDHISCSQPDDDSLRCGTVCDPKTTVFQRESWNRWFTKCNQRVGELALRFPLKTELAGKPTSSSAAVKGELGEGGSGVHAGEKRMNQRSKK